MKQTEWTGLYKSSWSAAPLVPEAYSHPAKVAFGLAQKIYEHMLGNGWIKPGNKVIDPFGGIAGFGFHAMRYGLHWQGVELEPKFVELAQLNIDLWNERYSQHFTKWGTAKICQGDSRNLANILAGQADTAVSSPAYADTIGSGEGPGVRHDPKTHKGDNAFKATSQAAYGGSNGQLGGMSAGDFDAAVSSSPFENSMVQSADPNYAYKFRTGQEEYGKTNGQIGNEVGQTFWAAARQIIEQTYMVLKPGAYVAFVCGDFIRKGERVHFGRQWMELCQAVGFEPVEYVTAWKREPGPVQTGMFGDVDKTIDRVSFFRRLANQRNPENEIVNEDVIFMRKPL